MESLFAFIKQMTTLSDESQDALAAVVRRMDLPKGNRLLRPGAVCHYLYFIEKGLTRTWYLKDGKDVTDWISAEGSFAVSIISFLTRQPDRRGIELLEDSTFQAIAYTDLENLYRQYHDIDRLGRLLLSHGIIQLQQRFDDLHFATAQQRYQQLITTNPSLVNRVPLGMIASFLGITQETLSRIRAQHSGF
ncbi:Crp/Fnr family transcriptional regulator [Puia dinghuensis]|uniref:DNA-binding protein n=1 Tax=Puia dinghuensis TaxID=1792502 RepID=A0A8J2XQP9_9BACT|nr:Crp/Fnr family transcriptional regulator [Puia dinghuensis]GGA85803.1 DNA-binding protein [Puia dinghuensis]